MNKLIALFLLFMSASAFSADPVVPASLESQKAMLESGSPQLVANKRLVYDLWRTVVVARHVDKAKDYIKEEYIQHNPNAETGLKGLVDYFSAAGLKPQPVKDTIDDLIAIIAEGDFVSMAFVREYDNPKAPGEKYTTTWFDMFRIEDGMVIEHWDSALISPP